MTNNISFKAQFVKPVFINRVSGQGNYNKCLASFVKLNPRDINDVKNVELLSKEWGNKASYIKIISQNLFNEYKMQEDSAKNKIYALTTQITDLENLNPKDIQGVLEIMPTMFSQEDLYISYFEINPKNIHSNPEKIYSKIGTEILDTIKRLFPKKKLLIVAGNDSQKFYEKNGFKETPFGLLEYTPEEY